MDQHGDRDATSRRRRRPWRWGLAAGLLVAVWGFHFVIGGIWLLVIGTLALVCCARLTTALCFVVGSPLGVCIILAAVSYFSGSAAVLGTGARHDLEFFNLDPELRCPRTVGWSVGLHDWQITVGARDKTVRLLGRLFGPMPGGYDGPYPTRDEALALLAAQGERMLPSAWSQRAARVGDRRIAIAERTWDRLESMTLIGLNHLGSKPPPDTHPQARGAILDHRCLVVQFLGSRSPLESMPTDEAAINAATTVIALIDIESGKAFAYYQTGEFKFHGEHLDW